MLKEIAKRVCTGNIRKATGGSAAEGLPRRPDSRLGRRTPIEPPSGRKLYSETGAGIGNQRLLPKQGDALSANAFVAGGERWTKPNG